MLKLNKIPESSLLWLVLIQWVIAFEWLKSGLGKFTDSEFMFDIPRTISVMIANTSYSWYADILKSTDARLWGNLTRFGEVFFGLVLAVGGWYALKRVTLPRGLTLLLVVALYGGAFMNLNFYFAAGWSSQAVVGVNLVMGLIQIVLGTYYLAALKKR